MHSIIIDNNQMEKVHGMTSEYPYVMHITDLRTRYMVPWHWHEEFEIFCVTSGAVRITTENAEYIVNKGEVSFSNSNVLETIVSVDDNVPTRTEAHLFHPCFLGGHFQSVFETRYIKPVINNRQIEVLVIRPDTDRGRKICRMVRDLGKLQQNEHVEFQTRNMLSEIWLLLLDEIKDFLNSRPEESIPARERIRYMLSYIHHHYGEKISLEDIAGSAAISEREALRTFKASLNKTPIDYLTDYRMSKARELLMNTEIPITEIALETGFSDSSYFGKLFRKYYQITPTEYRKDRQKRQPVPDSAD